MKNIFLSASIPLPTRHPKYYETADIIAIRDAIMALANIVLSQHRIIWGGHPSITPLIYYVIEKTILNNLKREDLLTQLSQKEKEEVKNALSDKIQNHVTLYQSLYFKNRFPPDNNQFENIIFTQNTGDIDSSIQLMRNKMLDDYEFSAAVFIGGMDGIELEYTMFREKHSDALVIPVASTGAATKILYNNLLPDKFKNERLVKDYAYMSLFQNLLMDKI